MTTAPADAGQRIRTHWELDDDAKRGYAQAGVPYYWIVDPARRTLEAYRLEGSRYGLPVELARDAVYEPQLFPGLAVELRELWM